MENFNYTGTDTLEIMANAVKYNRYLESLIIKYVPKDAKVLDIGAGIGTFAKKIASKGYSVHCIEPDPKQAGEIQKGGLSASLSVSDIEDNSVDFIYSLNVLEHIENDDEILVEWAKKLKPGGLILIYVPAFNVLYSSFDKAVGHFRRYRKKMLKNKVSNAGLQIVKAKYADSIGFFTSLVYKWIDNGEGKIGRNSLSFYDRFIFPISRFGDLFCSGCFGKNVYVIGCKET
ncbi:MAG: class I SAM-dependent methyltransferase [Bacteroidales bacterium]|jgi:ubiquinone/menaquinone biosynthesis C-methylase UbiE|nr:class I SAM-dependent methyltransferase [Bacteroidales bacterium]